MNENSESAIEVRDWMALRTKLVARAMASGLSVHEAEDVAQQAIVAVLEAKELRYPAAYALTCLARKIVGRLRARQIATRGSDSWLLANWFREPTPSLDIVAISAAIEQLAVWGRSGSTRRVLTPADEIESIARNAAADFETLLEAIDSLPVSVRQRRRYRNRLATLLRETIIAGHAGVVLVTPAESPESHFNILLGQAAGSLLRARQAQADPSEIALLRSNLVRKLVECAQSSNVGMTPLGTGRLFTVAPPFTPSSESVISRYLRYCGEEPHQVPNIATTEAAAVTEIREFNRHSAMIRHLGFRGTLAASPS